MLERAAGCLENAGRRFFRDANGVLRGRRSWYSHIRQKNGTNADGAPRPHLHTSTSDHRASNTDDATPKASKLTANMRAPVLDFLYPPRTQEFAALCLLRPSRRLVLRRKKKQISALSRSYTSEAADLYHPANLDKTAIEIIGGRADEADRKRAKQDLRSLLDDPEGGQYDKAWGLYARAGHPPEVNTTLLARLSTSSSPNDNRRAQRLFESIAADTRSAEDYLHMARSFVAVGQPAEINKVCGDAKSRGLDIPCWAFTFAHFVNEAQWNSAEEAWDSRPPSSEKELFDALTSQLDETSLPNTLLAFAGNLERREPSRSSHGLARFLLDCAFSNLRVAESMSTDHLLLLLREYNSLGIITVKQYFTLIRTLQSSDIRSTFIKSIVVYRNFRWQMEHEVPSTHILGGFLRSLTHFEITTGIQYFLDEYTRFYGKPSIDAYKNALIVFSRAGDVENISSVFDKFLQDHGKPLSRRLLTPLLYVHARVGDVRETLRQFERISKEFGLKQNTVCWNILLTAYANADDFEGAFATFKRMLKQDVEPNSHTFGTLMGLCANRGDIDAVRHLLSLAKKRSVQITAPLLDTIVEAYCNNQELEMAESVAESCLGLDVKGSRVRMWNLLLWNYAFRMDLDSISRIRSRMDHAGLQPDGMTYAALMLSLVLIGQTDSARRILRTLHRSHRMYATEFHYAIILYGYVKDRNRDMVHIIFREIKERFNRPGFSSRLLVLKSQLQRDLELIKAGGRAVSGAHVRLENAEKFLAETIADFDRTQMASKQPSPGAGRQPPTRAFPAMYYESMITAYGTRGASEKVRELFDQFLDGRQPSASGEHIYDVAPLRLVSALMLNYLKSEQYKKVEECWKITFPRAIKMATAPDLDRWLSDQLRPTETPEPPRPILPKSAKGRRELLVSSTTSECTALNRPSILPACRFLLSRPLSLYMRSLAYRNESWKIPHLVAEVQKAGFSLTTFNWSTFVQMLASSDKASDQVEAFTVFEDKFMPNFPGWNNIRRGYGLKPLGVPSTIDVMENPRRGKPPNVLGKESRRYWSKIQPDFMQPTYISMVYLASALHGFRERSIFDGGVEVESLYKTAPKTIAAIAEMPYLREKFQGVLLRRREEQGDRKDDLGGRDPFVWTGGILGVGGKPRPPTAVEQLAVEANKDEQTPTNDQLKSEPAPTGTNKFDVNTEPVPEGLVSLRAKTIDYQDEFDIEAETLLGAERESLEANEELLDNEHRVNIDEQNEAEMTDEYLYEDEEVQDEFASWQEQREEEEPSELENEHADENHDGSVKQDA
ncbi:putative translation regulator (Cya5) [Aspergillus clavatus NRRL 1]|uniref:Translation regulator (Cya5), putative n=1 Tax=Aspergillus clavatus (strain ATCC 1007 / CBS 513.65 / DSM 816 / NCTC 3887 / NRRL 1 / QM 1276 / 107) TaxID=344612 RepID=A1CRR2_ASPCL|nr:translation regulator (Cya5), putative [Aspergillus clavatus NRRL 1]EAW08333.1 translation regulator (Cya5), putative [Aspergillus clavatus NRRL 1]